MSIDTVALEDRLTKTFSEKLRIAVQGPEEDLIEAGLLDSLMFVDLLLHLERDFQLAIAFEALDVDHFRSIRRIAEFIAAAHGRQDVTIRAAGAIQPHPTGPRHSQSAV